MKLRYRFTILGITILIFLIISPVLVLFALGYKYDFETNSVVKTGSLAVKTEPARPEIFLDDEPHSATVNGTVRFLVPKDYQVTLRKDGYFDWSKRLSVQSELVTWANLNRDFVALFLKQPKLANQIAAQATFKNPDHSRLMFVANNVVSFLNSNSRDAITLSANTYWPQIEELTGAVSEDKLFYLLSALRPLNVDEADLADIEQLETNLNFLAFINSGNLTVLNSVNGFVFSLPDVPAFTLEETAIWYLESNNLHRRDLLTGEDRIVFDQTPAAGMSKIIRSGSDVFLILDDTLYTLNDDLEKIYSPVKYAYWNNQAQRLVFANDHEIFLFNPSGFETTLVHRSSTPIQQPVFNAETGYMFFMNSQKIKAIELDGRDRPNMYEIADAGDGFMVSDNGRLMHVYTLDEIKTFEIR